MPTRREMLSLGIGAFVVAAVPLAGRRAPRLTRRSVPAMGTVADLAVVHRDDRYAQGALDAAIGELRRVEAAMTRFDHDSEVGRVNRGAGRDAITVSKATAGVVAEAIRWAEATEGAFDPSIGRAVALWDVGHRHEPPPAHAVEAFVGRHLYRSIEIGSGRAGPVVRLHDPDAALDLGAIAKGYGVDRAVEALRQWGIRSGLVNLGGDLYALGTSPEGDPWKVGVRDPDHPDRLIDRLEVEEDAVATSGDYEQYFEHGGVRYHHLLDPATAAPRRTETRSVTVVAGLCATADAAATAVFGMGAREGQSLLRRVAADARIVGYRG